MGNPTPTPPVYRPRLIGPIVLIALGIIFLVAQFVPEWGVGKTWPVLLVVIGVMKLVDFGRPPRPPRGPQV
jgi:cell wall-active antibiotic response 4TMS protein YvqF